MMVRIGGILKAQKITRWWAAATLCSVSSTFRISRADGTNITNSPAVAGTNRSFSRASISDVAQSRSIAAKGAGKFFVRSPLIKMPDFCPGHGLHGVNVFLKLENLQPTGSFKDRGISEMIIRAVHSRKVSKVICSSGGNAGHAVANAALKLDLPVDVYIPTTTKPYMIGKLKSKGANVIVYGDDWNAADELARSAVAADRDALYVPPYDDPVIWEGHSTIVDEIAEQLHPVVPNKIVLAVGGGGLLAGVQQGVYRQGWIYNTDIIAVETQGTASFAKVAAGFPKIDYSASIDRIDSIATSLGAKKVTPGCLNNYCSLQTRSLVVSDRTAVAACRRFADDYNMLVEPACGAALSYAYDFDKIRWYRKHAVENMSPKALGKLVLAEGAGRHIDISTLLAASAAATAADDAAAPIKSTVKKRGRKSKKEHEEAAAAAVEARAVSAATAAATAAAVVSTPAKVDPIEEAVVRTWGARLTFNPEATDSVSVATHQFALEVSRGDTIVVVVCGGGVVNIDLMQEWCKQFAVGTQYDQNTPQL